MARFLRATEMAHALVRERVVAGDVVVDATAGNGWDTVFLAGLVGEVGKVWAFDVQVAAVEATRVRVGAAGFGDRVELVCGCHSRMGDVVAGGAGAAMFNLGYLPGADHGVVTRPESTIGGLEAAAGLLRCGGILSCVVYPGHEGGAEEAERVVAWFGALEQETFGVLKYGFENQRHSPPFLLAAERR